MRTLTSSHNERFKSWLSLLDGRKIHRLERAIVSGPKLVQEFLAVAPDQIEDVLLPPKLEWKDPKAIQLASPLYKELDVLNTKGPLLVVKIPKLTPWSPTKPKGLEIIIALGDPSNLGALLRSAEAFGASRVLLTKECCSPFLPKAIRASALACFRLPLFETNLSLEAIELQGDVVGLDKSGTEINKFNWPKNLYLVLGQEGPGIPAHFKTKSLSIPMSSENLESLNATVAASIAMFSYRQTFPYL